MKPQNPKLKTDKAPFKSFDALITKVAEKQEDLKRRGELSAADALTNFLSDLKAAKTDLLIGTINKSLFFQRCDHSISKALSSELKNHRDLLSKCVEPLIKWINYLAGTNFFETKSTKMLREIKHTIQQEQIEKIEHPKHG